MKADIIVKSIIVNTKRNRILLVQRSKSDDTGANTWENAGGNVECGETPEEAMLREIREETGITEVTIDRVAYVTLVNGEKPYLIIAYLCETCAEEIALSSEHQAYIWADAKDCKNMLPAGIVEDFENNKIFEYME